MKLTEAITILLSVEANPKTAIRGDFPPAIKLGIEALKFINAMGECPYCHVGFTLPGETTE